ncbi:MAG: hypothetical protein AMXMBFR7_28980 [Planctomycetota bacterium]
MRRPWIFLSVVLLGITADQFSKVWVFSTVPADGLAWWPDVLHFTPVINEGVAFSMLAGQDLVILTIAIFAVCALIAWYWKRRQTSGALVLATQSLLLIGAIGNLIDRVIFGGVRDFFDFRPELPFVGHWAIFNVADICICVGVCLFVWYEFKQPETESAPTLSSAVPAPETPAAEGGIPPSTTDPPSA